MSTQSFTAPRNFAEFIERYPRCVSAAVYRKRGLIPQNEMEDVIQEIYVHLASLPEDSIYRERGCVDRISTFDPEKTGGEIEPLFFHYVYTILDNFLHSRYNKLSNHILRKSMSLEDFLPPDVDEATEEKVQIIPSLACSPYDSVKGLAFEEALSIAEAVNPRAAWIGFWLSVGKTYEEFANEFGVSLWEIRRSLKLLRSILDGNDVGFEKWRKVRERPPYAPRKKKQAVSA